MSLIELKKSKGKNLKLVLEARRLDIWLNKCHFSNLGKISHLGADDDPPASNNK